MSHGEHTTRCRGWLDEQLEALAGIRNANPRDTEFKAWRQATMTVLQRIWPDDPARVERFRRIAFRAPGARPEAAMIREWHSRGCEQAHAYLTELLKDLDAHGAPAPSVRMPDAERASGAVAEDDFPVVELPHGDARPAPASAIAFKEDNLIDLGGPKGEIGPAQGRVDDDETAPPQLRVELPVAREEAPSLPDAPMAPPTLHAPGAPKPAAQPAPAPAPVPAPVQAAAPEPVAPPKPVAPVTPVKTAKRASGVSRLKDMLGFTKLEAAFSQHNHRDAAPAPAAPAPAPTPAPVAQAPAQQPAPPAPAPVAQTPAAPPTFAPAPPPVAQSPAPAEPPQDQGVFATQPRPLKRNPSRMESLESLVPEAMRTSEPAAPAPAAPAPAPEPPAAAAAADQPLDADTFAAAADEFLRSSPVLGLTGKPVQRLSDATAFLDPDAVAIAALANDAGRLGVEEGSRASARALLLGLARDIEDGQVEWKTLRNVVAFAMESPELARRLLPIVLPWLERAA